MKEKVQAHLEDVNNRLLKEIETSIMDTRIYGPSFPQRIKPEKKVEHLVGLSMTDSVSELFSSVWDKKNLYS